MTRIKKIHGPEVDRFSKKLGEDLVRFNITKQRIADRANAIGFDEPWEDDKAYSTWHRALDGQEVWVEIVSALEALHEDQLANPRDYLPGPPTDDLFDWMKQIAGATWWVSTLGLDVKANTLTAWMTRGCCKPDKLAELRAKVDEWWAKFDAACTQAEMVARVHRCNSHGTPKNDDHRGKNRDSWDSYLYTYIVEQGRTVDEGLAHFIEMNRLAEYCYLTMIDLADPQLPCVEVKPNARTDAGFEAKRAARFDDDLRDEFRAIVEAGYPRALPTFAPPDFDPKPYTREQQWPDRRSEEGRHDVNAGIYKLHYRERVMPFWDADARGENATSEIVAVSVDGISWREPTEREKQGWLSQIEDSLQYLNEHGEMPENAFKRQLEAARTAVKKARQAQMLGSEIKRFGERELELRLREAEAELERARNDY